MPALKHVVLLDKIDPSAAKILSDNGVKTSVYEKFSEIPSELIASLDGIVIRSATRITAEAMDKCPNLVIIGRAGTGVDNIDVPAATARGIVVMNTPGGNTISAAEHTCFMIIALARNAANNNANMKNHKWVKGMGTELVGKTLGIVGLGRIGCEVATRMQSFGMRTIGFDPIVNAETAAQSGISWMTLDEMWPQCDYITVHTPLIPQTKDLIGEKSLAKCKKGVKVINVARGGIVSEEQLLVALESGQCGGAGLDVFESEPVKDWTLVDHPNVIATSHLGASTKEAQLKCGQEIAQQFVDFANNVGGLVGVINSPALVSSLSVECSPWLNLASALGQVLAKTHPDKVKGEWKVDVFGVGYPTGLKSFVVAAVAAGALKGGSTNAVNVINAPSLAEKAGISVKFSQSGDSCCSNVVTSSCLKLTTPGGNSACGYVNGSRAYLANLDGSEFVDCALNGRNMFALSCNGGVSAVLSKIGNMGSLQRLHASNGAWVIGALGDADSSRDTAGIVHLEL